MNIFKRYPRPFFSAIWYWQLFFSSQKIIAIVCCFCSFEGIGQKIPDLYDYKMPVVPDGPINLLNADNKVFKSNRKFVYDYQASYPGDSSLYQFKILPYWSVNGSDTILRYNHEKVLKKKEFEEEKDKYPITNFTIEVLPYTHNYQLAQTQTLIKYHYYNGEREIKAFTSITGTGVIEDSTTIFLHNPRDHCFKSLQFAAHPAFSLPIDRNSKWNNNLYIPRNRALSAGLDTEKDMALTINHQYLCKETIVNSTFGTIAVHKFETESINEEGKTMFRSEFLYNETYGFLKMLYERWDGETITINLIKVIDNE
jgi:hypothetical protein